MEQLFIDHGYGLIGILANVFVAYLAAKARAEIAELKVFMFQNFQRIKDK